jgi:hypothetical protein
VFIYSYDVAFWAGRPDEAEFIAGFDECAPGFIHARPVDA